MSRSDIDPALVGKFADAIDRILRSSKGRPVSLATMLVKIQGASKAKRAFKIALREHVAAGKAVKLANKHYALPSEGSDVVGRFKMLPSGRSIVIAEGPLPKPFTEYREIHIGERQRDTALSGDRVRVLLNRERRDGSPSGAIKAVLDRGTKAVVGRYRGAPRSATVVPHGDKLGRVVRLAAPLPPGTIQDGDWVEVEITDYTSSPQPLLGKFLERLGTPGDRGIEITVLLRSMGCREAFPEDVEREVAAFPDALPKSEMKFRRDLRKQLIFTMDGADAKDFDDAISIERLPNNHWMLGVHIADVSHYVQAGTRLDADAYDRSTSIYPLDRVVPMLPERLSNDLCSLVPNKDRPAISCEMEIGPRGKVHSCEIFESVIHSRHRLTYEAAQKAFDAHDAGKAAPRGMAKIQPALIEARELARRLQAMRMRRGALDLDVPEKKVVLNEEGRTVDVVRRDRLESHKLIEEFMLIANESVAEHMAKKRLPTLYRVHGRPDQERVLQLAPALRGLGLAVDTRGEWDHAKFQALLTATEKLEGGHVIRRILLRALKRAAYSEQNIGHFGLASEKYLHFTSPIRRYPDLLTHRAVRATLRLAGKKRDEALEEIHAALPEFAAHTSAQERQANEIEWEAEGIKSMELMEPLVGRQFTAIVSGTAAIGVFVELVRWPVEGLIKSRSLPGYWDFDEELLTLTNAQSGRSFRIGDAIEVEIAMVEPIAGQMDLNYIEHVSPRRPSRAPRGGRSAGKTGTRGARGAKSSRKDAGKSSGRGPIPRGKSKKPKAKPSAKGSGKRRKR